jgi:hypothetical protein
MIMRTIVASVLVTVGLVAPWPGGAALSEASPSSGLPACTVSLPAGTTNDAALQLTNGEVLCAPGTFTNKNTISVTVGGSAVIEAQRFVNHGTVEAGNGSTLQLTSPPTNLRGTTLTGGSWVAAGTLLIPGTVTKLAADVTLSGAGQIEDSTTGSNAIDSLSSIKRTGTLVLNNSAGLNTGSVTSAGTIILGTVGDPGDAVNWQDSGTFTMTGGSFTFLDPNACINAGSRAVSLTGGTMSGFGMVTGAVAVSGKAVFAPTLDGAPASFWLNGSYSQTAGMFEDTVSNPSGTASTGSLWASGSVSVGGTLEVLSSGSKPAAGTTFQVISGSSASGSFKTVHNTGVAAFSPSIGGQNVSLVTLAGT